MKVLAIVGSPRKKGNTYQAVQRVRQRLAELDGSLDFEVLFLADCRLEMCRGCFACFAKGAGQCPLRDDRDMIIQKMLSADGVILAAPTYAAGVPAQMKNFIDRLAHTLHRPCFFDQAFLAVSTVGGVVGMKQALAQLAMLAAGAKKSLRLGVPAPPVNMPVLARKADKAVRKAAGALNAAMRRRKRHAPGFTDFAYFGAFKVMSALDDYKEQCPADGEYYRDKEAYFYPVGGVRAFFGRLLTGVMRAGVKLVVKPKTAHTGL